MSVYTTYDKIRDNLKDQLSDCIKLASELQNENIWGYGDINEEYKDKMLEVLILLQKAKRKI